MTSPLTVRSAPRRIARGLDALGGDPETGDKVMFEYLQQVIDRRSHGARAEQISSIEQAFKRGVNGISSLDEDRILHMFYRMICATLRTNYFQTDEAGAFKEYISFKLDSRSIPDLPAPRPYREIWVYSTRVEGIHLRMGPIARGGLRWWTTSHSETEVLGLMKAQGRVQKHHDRARRRQGRFRAAQPEGGDREAVIAEGTACYKIFINGLLDITDNLDEEERVIPPKQLVRRDGDDPYLVVAADKGTATFSDTANALAQGRRFWMGDAFASGGSVGYDHKGMGITAEGAWEGVKRHFREMGRNIQKEPFTVVGIGDMSGDVFGNGMLLSKQIRLQAAFNHLHIFLDPDPDPAVSFKERKRLFALPRSGWTDYNPAVRICYHLYLRNRRGDTLFKVAPRLLGIDLKKEAKKLEASMSGQTAITDKPELFSWAAQLDLRAYRVTNPKAADKTVSEIESLFLRT